MTLPNPRTPNEADSWRAYARREREEGYATGYAAGLADAAALLERDGQGAELHVLVARLRSYGATATVAPGPESSDVVGRRPHG